MKNRIIEDSINRVLKKSFLENSYCCNDDLFFAALSEIDVRYKINYLTPDFISITSQMLTNCGAGGGNVIKIYNIDLENGKLLKNDDIFKAMSQQEYEEEMLKIWEMNKQDKYNKDRFFEDCYGEYNFSYRDDLEIAFTKETVIFIFAKNGSCGPLSIEIRKNDVKNIINSKLVRD
ncbi:hypothetical protein LJC68_05750 [Bacteroidales bacterium OttesenSCG-928-B11]|nr:hypothetical protein [Bacteroidales bacterium OttesenSCG-928-E04]MDL2312361.1 hypothetical protein [Bacteroidales bacterium OttesenSCG-928-B11]MDL2326594.1 hypothetical protein [Bacteroidales bacterium OttesenSCG-928-A14]